MTDPSKCCWHWWSSLNYFGAAVDQQRLLTPIVVANHGLNTRDLIYVQELPGATRFGPDPLGAIDHSDA